MYNLIPHFIEKKYQENSDSGDFSAFTIFMDISGFTSMTETLMKQGVVGAEVLSNILNEVFDPIIHSVYDRGGFISGFAGDAFTAVFSVEGKEKSEVAQKICMAAQRIQETFEEKGKQTTRFGDFDLKVKMGLAFGDVSWGIIGTEGHKAYFFKGSAVDGCAQAEHNCQIGEIVIENQYTDYLEEKILVEGIDDKYSKLKAIQADEQEVATKELKPLDLEMASKFYPEIILQAKEVGEFRELVSVFVSFQPFETKPELNGFISFTLSQIDSFGGYFNRLDFGDKGGNMLMFFGAPISYENDLERALNFILKLKTKYGEKIRAGITHAKMFAGFVGIPQRCEYTALGNAVNFSARLMMKADWGEILVPRKLTQYSDFKFNKKGDFEYKGFTEKVATYKLLGEKASKITLYTSEMVGRKEELEKLEKSVKPILNNKFGNIFYIYGEAGMGKTRLVYELSQKLGGEVNWIECQADQILSIPFNPFSYALNQRFKLNQLITDAEKKKQFGEAYQALIDEVGQLIPEKEDENSEISGVHKELIRTKSIIGALVGLHWENSLYEQLDGKGKYENTLFAIKTWLQAESLLKPTILQMEDGHWIDNDSEKVLKVLCRRIESYPILILSTLRYNDDGTKHKFPVEDVDEQEIDLNFLSEEDVETYAEMELEEKIGADLHKFLLEKTKGNPFFVQQVSQYLKEHDFLKLEDGEWILKRSISQVPGSLQSILIARIDRLSQEVKEVVKTASVIGREFEVNLLSEILKSDISTPLQKGEKGQIWSALNELQYLFKHTLLRDAAYEMQLSARLRELHQATAEAIERLYENKLEDKYASLALHYERAENAEKTLEYLEKAADKSKELYQNQQALEFYDKLIDMLRVKAGLSKEDLAV